MVSYEVKDKVVLVTGGATGIGLGIVNEFISEGARHVAILDLAEEAGKQVEKDLNSKYGNNKAKFFKCDVSDDSQLFNAYDETIKSQGYIDVVVNNAGLMNDSKNVYKKMIEVNVTALITSSLKALQLMRKDKGGKGGAIINVASIVALSKSNTFPIYNATKIAVLHFDNCIGMKRNFDKTGVRVVTVCFGPTDTPLLHWSKIGLFDDLVSDDVKAALEMSVFQKPESAVKGLLASYKHGATGSVWLSENDEPAIDITDKVGAAYNTMYKVPDFIDQE